MTRYIILFVLAAQTLFVGAQSTVSEKYRNQVLEYNQDLKAAERNIQASIELQKAAKGDMLPHISAGASYKYTVNPLEISTEIPNLGMLNVGGNNYHNYGVTATAVQPIFTGGRVLQSIKMAEHNTSYSQNIADILKLNVSYQADVQYWSTVAYREITDITKQYQSSVANFAKVVKQRVDLGLIDPQELLMAEVKLNEAELRYLQSQNMFNVGIMAMNSLIGMDLESEINLDSIVTTPPLLRQSQNNKLHPELMLAQNNIDMAETKIKLAKSKYNPQLFIGVDGSYSAPGYDLKKDLDWNGSVYAKLSIPIWSGGKRGSESRAEKQKHLAAQYGYQKVEDAVNLETKTAIANYNEAWNRINLTDKSLQKAIENESKAMERYKEGNISIVEVIDAQIYTLNARTACVQSKLEAQVAYAEYMRTTGIYAED